jgi:hypothetical protein
MTVLSLEFSLHSRKSLDVSAWQLGNHVDEHGRLALDTEPYPRNLFVLQLAGILQQVLQLAARYGYSSKEIPRPQAQAQDLERIFRFLGGAPAGN